MERVLYAGYKLLKPVKLGANLVEVAIHLGKLHAVTLSVVAVGRPRGVTIRVASGCLWAKRRKG